MTAALKVLAAKIANEPIVHLAGTLASALTWLATYVLTDFDPDERAKIVAGAANIAAYGLAWIARQYVTPTVKQATGRHAVSTPAPVAKPVTPAPVVTSNAVGFALPDPEAGIPEEYPLEGDDAYPALPA